MKSTENQKAMWISTALTAALPYIRRLRGRTVVVKYGGNAMADEYLKSSFARDIVLLQMLGINPVVVHGGGPQITRLLQRIGKQSEFVDGMRVTDAETMEAVQMVLGGLVNKEIVDLLNSHGGCAVGLTGKDGGLIRTRKLIIKRETRSCRDQSETIDLGYVGEVESIDPKVINVLAGNGFIPVIAPIGIGADNESYNINADLVAGEVAAVLEADRLMLLTNTMGLLDANGALIQSLTTDRVEALVADGTIHGGMLPKVHCALDAVNAGVNTAVIMDGRVEHAVLLNLLTDQGVGTLIETKGCIS